MARGGGNKKRFHHCTDPSGQEILYLRALQGHSGRNLTDPSLREESVNSERFLRVQLPHRMCNQITLHHDFRIDIRRTKFEPEIYSKRLNAKEVIFPKQREFIFPAADGRIKLPGGDQDLRTSTLIREHPIRGEGHAENQKGLFHNLKTHFRMPVKPLMIFGPCQETSKTAITLNPESSFTRREKNHSLFH